MQPFGQKSGSAWRIRKSGGKRGLVMQAVPRPEPKLIPVDSEHNGAHQCLRAGAALEVSRLILTAREGRFATHLPSELAKVTPEQALNHPTWKMGRRITIDSATLMNKGFEVIEACWLFDLAPVASGGGGTSAILGPCHGRIQRRQRDRAGIGNRHADADPIRDDISGARARAGTALDWTQPRTWTFSAPDLQKFRLLRAGL